MTSYEILRFHESVDDTADVWANAGAVTASSATQAVRKHADKAGAGTYVAIPARQFKPLTVHVETVQRVKIGGAA